MRRLTIDDVTRIRWLTWVERDGLSSTLISERTGYPPGVVCRALRQARAKVKQADKPTPPNKGPRL